MLFVLLENSEGGRGVGRRGAEGRRVSARCQQDQDPRHEATCSMSTIMVIGMRMGICMSMIMGTGIGMSMARGAGMSADAGAWVECTSRCISRGMGMGSRTGMGTSRVAR